MARWWRSEAGARLHRGRIYRHQDEGDDRDEEHCDGLGDDWDDLKSYGRSKSYDIPQYARRYARSFRNTENLLKRVKVFLGE